jgi:hypothetical protein
MSHNLQEDNNTFSVTFWLTLNVVFILMMALGCASEHNKVAAISYNTHIRPILSDKCFKCHGPDAGKRKSGYRLDTEEGAFALLRGEKNKYGIVRGHPAKSEVFLRIKSQDTGYMMPPPESNLALSDAEKDLIGQWIKEGAQYQKHWAFIPLADVSVPDTDGDGWVANEIDHFILAGLREKGLEPSEVKYDAALLKRMMHDVTGLPPNVSQQDEYMQKPDDRAYEKMVDMALASPRYGEKMAVFWMDLARYADSHGYQDDGLRTMWPWRDWVIHAFNSNYSYDKFVTWQLAGDLLPDKNKETILATGFNRNHKITQEGGVIDEEYRVEYVTDRTNTFGKGLLAMTFECAKCHDHKYDPISQKDYYGTFAFFNQVNEKGLNGDISVGSLADPPFMTITDEDQRDVLKFINKSDTGRINVMIMKDSAVQRQTRILLRGMYDRPGDSVAFGTPEAILRFDAKTFENNRLGLAKWLFDRKNPLTARVFVNFMWQEFFGRGIVRTSGDFGLQGDLPSHPALLDWLAYDFMTHGWNIKRLVRQIVMSSAYRQSTAVTETHLASDPDNVYLARGPRLRLSAELLKDHLLASAGLLNPEIGGPSVKPYQPKGLWESATSGRGQLATYIEDEGIRRYRRGLYHFIKRTVPPPSMLIFDASNRDQCEVKRSNTNTPLQSLVLMNDRQVLEAARHLAFTKLRENTSADQKIESLFKNILCRLPKARELEKVREFYRQTLLEMNKDKARKILGFGDFSIPEDADLKEVAAMMQTVMLLFNLEETSVR